MNKSISKVRVFFLQPVQKILARLNRRFDLGEDIVEIRGFPTKMRLFAFRDPDHIEKIFSDPVVGQTKSQSALSRTHYVMGEGSYMFKGDAAWKERRQQVQLAFSRPRLVAYVKALPPVIRRALEGWKEDASNQTPVDIHHCFQTLNIRIIFKIFFSLDLDHYDAELLRDLTLYLEENLLKPWPLWLPLPSNFIFKRRAKELRNIFREIILSRIERPRAKDDLLDSLLSQPVALTGNNWNVESVVDEITAAYLGANVMNVSMTWAAHLFSIYPDQQDKAAAEVDSVLESRDPTDEDLLKLKFNQWSLQEAIRLYPSSWTYPRYCEKGMAIDGYKIPPNSLLLPMVYYAHHDTRSWKNAERFDPERFNPANKLVVHPGAYMPFGRGPRQCFGVNLAPMVMKMVFGMIFQRFRFEFRSGVMPLPEISFGFEIQPKRGVMAVLRPVAKKTVELVGERS